LCGIHYLSILRDGLLGTKMDENYVIERFEMKVKEAINKGYSLLIKDINQGLNNILSSTINSFSELEGILNNELVEVKRAVDNVILGSTKYRISNNSEYMHLTEVRNYDYLAGGANKETQKNKLQIENENIQDSVQFSDADEGNRKTYISRSISPRRTAFTMSDRYHYKDARLDNLKQEDFFEVTLKCNTVKDKGITMKVDETTEDLGTFLLDSKETQKEILTKSTLIKGKMKCISPTECPSATIRHKCRACFKRYNAKRKAESRRKKKIDGD